MKAIPLIQAELQDARETYSGVMKDVTPEMLHKDPGGKALPLGALWAHLVLSEDITIQQFIQIKTPLSETTFKDNTGASALMPPMDQNWESAHEAWAKTVKIDTEKFKAYEAAVYKETENYIQSLTDEDLDTEVDLGAWGKKTVGNILYAFILGHTFSISGEASAIKGVFGQKGYAF